MLSVSDLAGRPGAELELDGAGRPARPLLLVDLDSGVDAPHAVIETAALAASQGLPLMVGLATTRPPDPLRSLLRALTVSLVVADERQALPRECVGVPDLTAAAGRIHCAIRQAPGAALALNRLLRQTAQLDVRSGLAAEAAVYSMLLGGPEFPRLLAARVRRTPRPDQDEQRVRLTREHERLMITLDRPHRRNAMDARMREDLVAALEVALLDDGIKEVELRGVGPGFCSGGDLDEFGTATDYVAAYLVRLERNPGWLVHLLSDRVHARLHGACIGAGLEIPLFAQHVSAAPESFFMLPEVAMGLVPGAGGTVSVPQRIGRWRAAWMALTGARVGTSRALAWGLVDAVERTPAW
ncbi:enoyl-CoA hydratase/isomerase family protein [Nonomuraea sp. NPDC002799]